MTEIELNATAEGLFEYLKTLSDDPRDGIGILGIAVLMLYDNTNAGMPLEKFLADFSAVAMASYRNKKTVLPEQGTLQ